LHAALLVHALAIVPALGSHFAPVAVYLLKQVLHAFVVTSPGTVQ